MNMSVRTENTHTRTCARVIPHAEHSWIPTPTTTTTADLLTGTVHRTHRGHIVVVHGHRSGPDVGIFAPHLLQTDHLKCHVAVSLHLQHRNRTTSTIYTFLLSDLFVSCEYHSAKGFQHEIEKDVHVLEICFFIVNFFFSRRECVLSDARFC